MTSPYEVVQSLIMMGIIGFNNKPVNTHPNPTKPIIAHFRFCENSLFNNLPINKPKIVVDMIGIVLNDVPQPSG